ncbi:MAG: hypothetical protein IKT95_00045 [Spirochaetales bacterium]|nr:hypothetical protein [Spirochaetales bacterium]
MKKSLVLLLCLLSVVSLFASDFLDELRDGKSYIPDHVLLYTGNDKFNYGITRNDDDQLSYSFDFMVESPLWYLRFNANGFTNRGWRDGWDMRDYDKEYTPGARVVRGRYDSLETVAGFKLRPVENDFYIHLYPEIGFALVGNYGWEWGQNAVHRISGIHEVDLPYDNDGAKNVRLMLDGRVNIGYKLLKLKRTSLIAEIEASTKNIMGFQTENQILGRISVSTQTHDLLGFHFGYTFASELGDYPSYTRDLYLQYLTGWKMGFTIDTGIIYLKYTGSLETGYGYGYMGFNVLGFFEPRSWDQTDAYLSFSKARFYDSFYNYISVGIPLSDRFSLVLKNAYLGGNPVNKKEEEGLDLTEYSRFKREYSSFAFGVRFNLPSFASDFITPYIELTAGMQIYKIFTLNNQLNDEVMDMYDIPNPSYLDNTLHYYPLLSLEGGITVLPEELVVFQDTSIQIDLFGGFNYVFGGDTVDLTYYRYVNRWGEDISYSLEDRGPAVRFLPYFGFGLKLGFDL